MDAVLSAKSTEVACVWAPRRDAAASAHLEAQRATVMSFRGELVIETFFRIGYPPDVRKRFALTALLEFRATPGTRGSPKRMSNFGRQKASESAAQPMIAPGKLSKKLVSCDS